MFRYICILVSTLFFRDEGVKHKGYPLRLEERLKLAIGWRTERCHRFQATCTRALTCVHMTIACGTSPYSLMATSAMPEWVLLLQLANSSWLHCILSVLLRLFNNFEFDSSAESFVVSVSGNQNVHPWSRTQRNVLFTSSLRLASTCQRNWPFHFETCTNTLKLSVNVAAFPWPSLLQCWKVCLLNGFKEGERLFWAHSHCDIMKGGTQGFPRHEVSDKQEVLFEDVSPSTAFSIRQLKWSFAVISSCLDLCQVFYLEAIFALLIDLNWFWRVLLCAILFLVLSVFWYLLSLV